MDLSNKLAAIAKKMNVNFTLKNRMLSYAEAFSDKGLLPALTKRADQLAYLCLGYGLGANYQDVQESLLGITVIFDEFTPNTLRLLCILDVIQEIMKNSASQELVALDELLYD